MTTDQSADVVRRAALHAVLGDPGRLAVVDLLAWSDRSPSELAESLGMTSNLLAHHVNLLLEHGLVRRRRSEGDRRRTYLSLVPGALAELVPVRSATALPPERVVFVCTANSARSQLAAALWRRTSPLPATSAGTHPARSVAPGAARAAARHHLGTLEPPRAVQDVLAATDLVVTVCDRAHEETGRLADAHWSVPDPVPAGRDAAFEAAIAELGRRVDDLAPRLDPARITVRPDPEETP
ncbi:MarR family transcriptional regulator [Actinotalea sp. M2MS4P-6]|uniref:arsenate reductase/protein-tyrosine-phosphatase family protein n=1 Tax=Actinotalea sp. M2MS4P-6 TaxID=2983762 RepID=UPI0021E48FB7|nr:MarR family transcriptional regulator [Actinotalea sp. M2MS4P-6]MCV2395761.1 MarR family transcriptional regulator [Actinotalea sp. M2MS4P-6]